MQGSMNHKGAGTQGEDIAAQYLLDKGYSIAEQNYRIRQGELDLIVWDPAGVLVFVEVKTSRTDRAGIPAEWVTLSKQRQIYRIAHKYCSQIGFEDEAMRFDVIGVELRGSGNPDVIHYENAFIPSLN